MNFLDAAVQILETANTPLHYREITKRALEKNLIETDGKTPWATMSARLSTDIIARGELSPFVRTDPGFYGLKEIRTQQQNIQGMARIIRHEVNENLNSKEKGDIGEARVAELITLYGQEALSCYKPISDSEGIDLIVKRKGKLDVVYIQVKTTFGYKDRGFVATVNENKIPNKARMIIVFAYFDLSEGDIYPNLFCIPAPQFLKLTRNEKKITGDRVFTVGLKGMAESKYAEFMIEKRELANRILEILENLSG